jgi:hypothetical protein
MPRLFVALIALFSLLSFSGCGTTATAPDESVTSVPGVKIIDNCEGRGIGGVWSTYSDADNDGGNSTSLPVPFVFQKDGNGANGTKGYAKFSGTVTKKYQYGFSGLTYDFNKDKKTALDISGFTGFSFWMKGDGNFYNFAIKTPSIVTDFAYYEFGIKTTTDWKEYKVPFTQFTQESWGKAKDLTLCLQNATGFQIQTIGQPIEKFEASIDEVALYK